MADQAKKTSRSVRPPALICRRNDGVALNLEMPGVRREDVSLTVDGDTLSVSGNRSPMSESARYVVRERDQGDFMHSFTLDETIDRGRIDAAMNNGILTIQLHTREEEKPKKITIRSEE